MALRSKERRRLQLDASSRALISRLIRNYVRPYRLQLALSLLCMLIIAGTTAALTQLIKPIIDEIFTSRDETLLVPIAIAALAIFFTKGMATFFQAVLMSFVGNRIVADLQSELFRRLLSFDLTFFASNSPGALISRFVNDLMTLRTGFAGTVIGIGKDFLTTLALVGVMFYEDWLLAIVSFFAFPLAIFPMARVGRRMRKVVRVTQVQLGRFTTILDEAFQGVRYVKAYGMEDYEMARAKAAIEENFRLTQKATRTRNMLHPIMETLGGLAVVGVILYGGHMVLSGGKNPGSFFAFMTALLLAYEPLKRLARLNTTLQEALAAAQRIFDLLDQEPAIKQRTKAKPLEMRGGAVRFEKVTFAYHGDAPALTEVDLEAPAGKTVALVGASGAGKSTVLNLIPRFYDVDGGRVMIDGQNVRDVTLASLRASLALVSQETLLFDDSVRANIAYGRPSASEEEIEAAAKAAAAHEFIAALPEGYETAVGPRGVKLSGGQRQRIVIARAMLRDAPILLMDEATSALDSESERQVQDAIERLKRGRTTIVIAHRLSTVMGADRIYVLDQGRVIEEGRHEDLIRLNGAYARLYALQFAEGVSGGDEAQAQA